MVFSSGSFPNKEVKVTVFLTGGHEKTFYLQSDDPLLHKLVSFATAPEFNEIGDSVFQVPFQGDRAALYFPREHLVALITEPPINLNNIENIQPIQESSWQQTQTGIIPSEFVQLDGFLTREEQKQLLDYVIARENDFTESNTSTEDLDYRQSLVLYSFPDFSELIVSRIKKILPQICSQLEIPLFNPTDIETQLTAHNEGNYYRIHNDSGSPDTLNRLLTYVYYFYRQPKPFTGGELIIYDSKVENNFYVEAESYQTIEPRQNSIVFFLSRYMHEVLPVSCRSQVFGDSRFTINGWLRE